MEVSQKEELLDKSKDVQKPGETSSTKGEQSKESNIVSRRAFVLGTGGIVVLGGIGGLRFMPRTSLVRPPGGQNEDRLISACVRCKTCFEVCPRDVISPAHIEDGIVTMQTPTFNFYHNYCDWCEEENDGVPLCAASCPTLALELPPDATSKNTILGKAAIKEDWCLAYRLIGCRFCYDACPYDAMGIDDIGRPYVITENCNGCGACESVCVSLKVGSIPKGATERAIIVRPLDAV